MSEQDNVFPFGKFDPDKFRSVGGESNQYDPMLAVINGLQQNMMLLAQKIDVLEHKVKELENHE